MLYVVTGSREITPGSVRMFVPRKKDGSHRKEGRVENLEAELQRLRAIETAARCGCAGTMCHKLVAALSVEAER